MSDAELRELERLAKAGDPTARARAALASLRARQGAVYAFWELSEGGDPRLAEALDALPDLARVQLLNMGKPFRAWITAIFATEAVYPIGVPFMTVDIPGRSKLRGPVIVMFGRGRAYEIARLETFPLLSADTSQKADPAQQSTSPSVPTTG